MNSVFYFAYGSNMSLQRLHQRVSAVRMVSVARLDHHILKFHKKSDDGSGKCDAYYVDNPEENVYGIVFELKISQLHILDRYEGLGEGYEQKSVQVGTPDSGTLGALTYYATEIDSSLKPYQWYKEHVLYGANEHNLPKNYINQIENVAAIPDLNASRHEKELRIYR